MRNAPHLSQGQVSSQHNTTTSLGAGGWVEMHTTFIMASASASASVSASASACWLQCGVFGFCILAFASAFYDKDYPADILYACAWLFICMGMAFHGCHRPAGVRTTRNTKESFYSAQHHIT
jgi:hypothetical protein